MKNDNLVEVDFIPDRDDDDIERLENSLSLEDLEQLIKQKEDEIRTLKDEFQVMLDKHILNLPTDLKEDDEL